MAEVYLAEQNSLGRLVAIKILDQHSGDPDFVERFLKEARLVASLNHPGIITIYDFGVLKDKRLYLSMEYIEGGDLDAKLAAEVITEEQALAILKQLVKALQFVHGKGIIHRDIKPANVLFRHDGSIALTDFGIAKTQIEDVKLTQVGTAVGSPAYCSPEQAQGLDVDCRSDIYSTGVVFVELLLGRNPYKADSFVNTSINHIQMEIPQLRDTQGRFQNLIEKMLAKDPQDRFESAEQLLAYLNNPANYSSLQLALNSQKVLAQKTLSSAQAFSKTAYTYFKTTIYPVIKTQTIFIATNLFIYAKRFAIYCQTTVYPWLKKTIIYLLTELYKYSKIFIIYCRTTLFPRISSLTLTLIAKIKAARKSKAVN